MEFTNLSVMARVCFIRYIFDGQMQNENLEQAEPERLFMFLDVYILDENLNKPNRTNSLYVCFLNFHVLNEGLNQPNFD